MTLTTIDPWRDDVGYLEGAVVVHGSRVWRAQRQTMPGEQPGHGAAWLTTAGSKRAPANPMLAERR